VEERIGGAEPAGKPSAARAFGRAAGMLAIASVVAALLAGAIFVFVFHAEFLTGAADAVNRFLFAHSLIAVAAAASPVFAALLVGYAYMQRAVRRRAAQRAAPPDADGPGAG